MEVLAHGLLEQRRLLKVSHQASREVPDLPLRDLESTIGSGGPDERART